MYIVAAVIVDYWTFLEWKKTKLEVHEKDSLWNTGLWKKMFLEILVCLFMDYPTLYGHTYIEEADDWDKEVPFLTNDILFCIMLYCRYFFAIRTLLSFSFYTDPRS